MKPNTFIVGAVKSGTTALREALRAHQDVFVPAGPEPVFFGNDLEHHWRLPEHEYLALFDDWNGQRIVLDKAVWNLYSGEAANEIHDFAPDARIIALLREPVSLMVSLHQQFLRSGNESESSFEKALSLEAQRASGNHLPSKCYFPAGLQYRDVVRFGAQLARYQEVFGASRVLALPMEWLRKDEALIRSRVEAFLELAPGSLPKIVRENVGYRFRNKKLHRLTSALRRYQQRRGSSKLLPFIWRLERLNRAPAKNVRDVSRAVTKDLLGASRNEAKILSALTQTDFETAWWPE